MLFYFINNYKLNMNNISINKNGYHTQYNNQYMWNANGDLVCNNAEVDTSQEEIIENKSRFNSFSKPNQYYNPTGYHDDDKLYKINEKHNCNYPNSEVKYSSNLLEN